MRTRAQIIEQLQRIRRDMSALSALDQPTPADWQRFSALEAEFDDADAELVRLQRDDVARRALRNGHTGGGDGAAGPRGGGNSDQGDDRAYSAGRRAVDAAVRARTLPDHAAERVTALLDDRRAAVRTTAGQWAATAGDPDYLAAFMRMMSHPQHGPAILSDAERRAWQRVEEFRAMSLTDGQGGYLVPVALDPAIILTNDGSTSPLRQVARVVQTTGPEWRGVTSAGVTARWHAEAAEMADDSPVLDDVVVPVHRGDAFVPFSFEIAQDAPSFVAEMSRLLVDGADQLMAEAYVTGSGNGEPTGLITGLTGTPSVVNSQVPETLTAADAYAVQAALPPRFSANARWLANVGIINALAQMETTNGALRFPDIATDRLLRKPLHELSAMDDMISPNTTAANPVAVYGDVAQGFLIADRIGASIELVPHLIGPNRRPTGQRGFILFFRTGSDVVVPNALRMLDVATTA